MGARGQSVITKVVVVTLWIVGECVVIVVKVVASTLDRVSKALLPVGFLPRPAVEPDWCQRLYLVVLAVEAVDLEAFTVRPTAPDPVNKRVLTPFDVDTE